MRTAGTYGTSWKEEWDCTKRLLKAQKEDENEDKGGRESLF